MNTTMQREQIGYMLDYTDAERRVHLGVVTFLFANGCPPCSQPFGADRAVEITLDKDLIVERGISKHIKVKAGTKVLQYALPLEGREIKTTRL